MFVCFCFCLVLLSFFPSSATTNWKPVGRQGHINLLKKIDELICECDIRQFELLSSLRLQKIVQENNNYNISYEQRQLSNAKRQRTYSQPFNDPCSCRKAPCGARCKCRSNQLPCTKACRCGAHDCQNPHGHTAFRSPGSNFRVPTFAQAPTMEMDQPFYQTSGSSEWLPGDD